MTRPKSAPVLRWLLATALLAFMSPELHAATFAAYHGWCEQGAQKVATSGLQSTTTVQQSYPACTVTVYTHGTTNLATIYSDAGVTPISNPYTTSANGIITFYADVSVHYDVVESGGTAPNTFATPLTISDVVLGGGGGTGGGSPGGLTNDIQTNLGGGAFGGTGGLFQWTPSTHLVSLSGLGQFVSTGVAIDFSGSGYTKPFLTGTQSVISGLSCTSGAVALVTDTTPQPTLWPCLGGVYVAPSLPAAPGSTGQLLANVSGAIGVYTGLYHDPVAVVTHFPGGGSFDSTKAFSISGTCPSATPLGTSAVGQALIGWDVGCIPKISFNGGSTLPIGLQGLIDYTYMKNDANGCWSFAPSTDDIGVFRVGTGVLGVMPCNVTSNPSKLNVYATFSSGTNAEWASMGFSQAFNAYIVTADHGASAGNYHPLYLGAAGVTNPFWGIQTVGPLTCLTTNPNCDIGSITNTQQIRNIWQAGFLAESIIGNQYPINAAGVQVGLVAARSATSPTQVQTATVAQTTAGVGIVAFLSNGSVTGTRIISGGTGYTGPTCSVSAPTVNSGVTATCTATQLAGVINAVTITNTGSNNGYQSVQATTITITDANGTGANILPILTATAGFAGIAANASLFSPTFDGNTTARDRVVLSTSVAGELHDSGIACSVPVPQSVQSFGCTEQTSTAGAGAPVLMSVNKIDASAVMMLAVAPSGTTCPTGAATASTCKDTITITPAMPDTNYQVNCNVASITSGVPQIEAILTADKLAGSFKTLIVNEGTSAAQAGTYDCTVRHQ